ncbi:MAG: RNA polymerase sigma factor [Kangiellaceae bacterium]|nr:RNA polymerase sigma factor [Kangiellaceae bacterium]
MLTQLTKEQKQTVDSVLLPPESVTDEQIVVHITQGNSQAYGGIMRRYNQRMFRIARSIVVNDANAMDVVQEAHIKAFSNLSKFRGSSTFLAWLFTITRNEALMYLRKHKREVTMSNDEINTIESSRSASVIPFKPENQQEQPESLLENKQLKTLINNHVDKLPEDFRIVFVLRAVEQLNVKETAEILDIKEETVKSRFFRAKRLMRDQIQTELDRVGLHVYEFGGCHCDVIVSNVLQIIKDNS